MSQEDNTSENGTGVQLVQSNEPTSELLTELKDHETWVCWKSVERDGKLTKLPVDAETCDMAKANDPSTWTDYETAVETADENDWGIGYMFDANKPVMGVDLDDCVDNGSLTEWAEKIVARMDTYWELSPSGTGLHALTHGSLPDNGNKKKLANNDTLEWNTGEVEMYDRDRFFTMTHDHLSGSPTEPKFEQVAIEDIHEEFIQDGSSGSDGSVSVDVEDLSDDELAEHETELDDEELKERMFKSQDGDLLKDFFEDKQASLSKYNDDHSAADQAFCNKLAFWTGGDQKWMDRLFRDSAMVRDKWLDRPDYRQRTMGKAVQECEEFYDPDSSSGSDTATSIGRKADGLYTYSVDAEGDISWQQLTNYDISLDGVIHPRGDTDDEQWELTIEPTSDIDPARSVTVKPTVFNDKRKFKKNVCVTRTSAFWGKAHDLNELRMYTAEQVEDASFKRGTKKVGLHIDHDNDVKEFVSPNQNLTPDGWTDSGHFVLSDGADAVQNVWNIPAEEEPDEDAVAEVIDMLANSRPNDEITPALGWFSSAMLKPYIEDWTDEFNILEVVGSAGSGKTMTMKEVWSAFGMDGNPFKTDSTKFALVKQVAGANLPLFYDEFKPAKMQDADVDEFKNIVRNVTTGATESKGQADLSSVEYHMNAPLCIAGEQSIGDEEAEARRLLPVRFKQQVTEQEQYKEAFDALQNAESDQHALAYAQFVLEQDDDDLRLLWDECEEHVELLIAEEDLDVPRQLQRQALVLIKFGSTLYRAFADQYSENPISTDNVDSAIVTTVQRMSSKEESDYLSTFFSIAGRAAKNGYLSEGEDYIVKDGQLRFKIAETFDAVHRYDKDNAIDETLLDIDSYRRKLDEYEDEPHSYVDGHSIYDHHINRCSAIDLDTAEDLIPMFEASYFSDDIGGQPDPTKLGEIDESMTRQYVSVTIRVNDTEEDATTATPLQGVVQDVTGAMDIVEFNHPDFDASAFAEKLEENNTYRIENAQVNQYEGSANLELVPKTTTVTEIADGVGNTQRNHQLKEMVIAFARDEGDVDRWELAEDIASQMDANVNADDVGSVIDRCLEQGRLMTAGDEDTVMLP